MTKEQHILWEISPEDFELSPLGYSVELGEDALASSKTATHSTFSDTGEFEYSISGGAFQPYPSAGISSSLNATVRMLRNGETPTSVLIVGNDSFLYKMSLDCKSILLYKQICETNSYSIDSVSCTSDGKIWVKDTGGVMTVLDRQFTTLNTFRLPPDSIFAAVDPFRGWLWQVSNHSVTITRTEDMSVVITANLPLTVSAVTSWDFSGPSGTLFVVLDNALSCAITPQGVVMPFSSGATGICQWGPKGALACIPGTGLIDIFDGTLVTTSISGASIGVPNPTRIASTGQDYIMVTDDTGLTVKADATWTAQWSIATAPLSGNIDVRTTPGPTQLGRITYLFSASGMASYRDMLTEGLQYGKTEIPLTTGRSPSLYPVVAFIPELSCSHIWAKITPTDKA